MKLHLEKSEVERVLTAYATHSLHIKSNRAEIQEDGSVLLSWDQSREQPKASTLSRLNGWLGGSTPTRVQA